MLLLSQRRQRNTYTSRSFKRRAMQAPEMPPTANGLFLSYNHADRESIRIIGTQLRARGVSTFLDSENLGVGLPWIPALSRALQEVQAVAVFIGKHGLGDWQMREVSFSLERQVQE